ncbi:MAG: hypothetical protein PUE04_04025 [Lachnospira sp.]|nr:hypothetical protein [Lachnospira sp.]
MKFGRTETKDAVSSETSHGVSNKIALDPMQRKWTMETKWYESSVQLPFEFLSIPAPAGYNEILTRYYGDWHTFEKGTSYHGGTFFDPDHPYTKYIK